MKREGILTHDDRPQPELAAAETARDSAPADSASIPQEVDPDFWQDAPAEQLSLFGDSVPVKQEKPSVLGQLAASKVAIKEGKPPEKQAKPQDPAL